jgi:hypothetical protein
MGKNSAAYVHLRSKARYFTQDIGSEFESAPYPPAR